MFVMTSLDIINAKFGALGINPALVSAYIMFETTVYNEPNSVVDASYLNHYLWAYFIGPLAGGALGGFLSLIHGKCANAKNRDNSFDNLIEK